MYSLSYFRTLGRIAEEPDIVPRFRRLRWLPRLGGPLETAIGQFSIRTLLRSRKHRLILAFYLGIGLALTILFVGLLAAVQQPEVASANNLWRHPNAGMLVSSVVMMFFGVLGTRVGFAMPLDLTANWIFRVTPVGGVTECLQANRRALLRALRSTDLGGIGRDLSLAVAVVAGSGSPCGPRYSGDRGR